MTTAVSGFGMFDDHLDEATHLCILRPFATHQPGKQILILLGQQLTVEFLVPGGSSS